MNFPEKGTIVKVKWFDAFSYSSSKESEIEKSCINSSIGEWFGVYEVEKDGKTIEYVDIRHEKSNGGTHDGLRIPSGWIISIEEYEPKIIGYKQPRFVTNETVLLDLNKCPKCEHKHLFMGEHFPCEKEFTIGSGSCECNYFERGGNTFTWRLIY